IDAAAEERIEQIHNHHDHHHAHGEHHEHAHDHFDSFVIQIGEVDSDKIQAAIQNVVSDFNIFRVKGFAALPGKPMRQVLQAVGKRLDSYFDRPW
ncbi:GTP-binding protein, partial [Oleiphilus sp. HI0061]